METRCRETCDTPCSKDNQPVCASNGKTYSNECMFKIAACEANKKGEYLKIEKKGDCYKPTPAASCDTPCSKDNQLVCASNGKTYSNECMFKIAACEAKKKGEYLKIEKCYIPECKTDE